MLDLIAASYRNIGPFQDQMQTLLFQQGKFLIKAPIGSGKSFLFFDGPSYALYKFASRNLLNIQSKIWMIKLLFAVDGQVYLIKRALKKGKSKDSCASQLFELSASVEDLSNLLHHGPVLNPQQDIEELLRFHGLEMSEVQFKNETDLQQHLMMLLPPHEVFVSTVILLQDAENIFEMQPAQRLEVLKNVFNLMGIEESKEAIKDKRNEVKYQIKAYQDTSRTEEKLKSWLTALVQTFYQLYQDEQLKPLMQSAFSAISELESLIEKLGIHNFELDEQLLAIMSPLQGYFKQQEEQVAAQKTELALLRDQEVAQDQQICKLQSEQTKTQQRIQELDQYLQRGNPEKLQTLRKEKIWLQTQQSDLENDCYTAELEQFYSRYQEQLQLQPKSEFSLLQNQQTMQELIHLGTGLKQKNQLLDAQLATLKTQQEAEQTRLALEHKNLQERKGLLESQLLNFQQQVQAFDAATEEQASYFCGETQAPCPFIKAINKQHFEQRNAEKEKMLTEITVLQQRLQNEALDEKLQALSTQLQNPLGDPRYQEQTQSLLAQKTSNQQQMDILRGFLQTIDLKGLEAKVASWHQLATKIASLEKEILQQEELLANVQVYQQEKANLEGSQLSFAEQIANLEAQKATLQQKIAALTTQIANMPVQHWQTQQVLLQTYQKEHQQLSVLISDYKSNLLKIKTLQEEEKILNNLYTILNKELLLFVLGEYLPILSEIINSYLSLVVDYQISIRIAESAEKLELETKIIDAKGERDIKSLSGGQRAILKLVWMLAISSYMKTKLLFLDETINNLDNETVGKVADLLNDFVKQRMMKFYTITHNSEIQAMNIWDQVITLDEVKK